MSAAAQVLADVPLFADLDDKERALLAERVDVVKLERGAQLFDYGDPGDWMGVVLEGRVEVTVRTKTGDNAFIELAERGDFFGEISLLDSGPRTARATVAEAGEMLVVDQRDLDELFRIKPQAALKLLKSNGKQLRAVAALLRNTATRNSYEEAREQLNIIQRAADWIANFSGSLTFLVTHVVLFTVYILLNVNLFSIGDFDPFPFGLLTMAVSLEAIILSTLLLYSSNRSTARDRVRADIEYDVNLKAELQIQHLHEKIDQMHAQILSRLDAIDHQAPPH